MNAAVYHDDGIVTDHHFIVTGTRECFVAAKKTTLKRQGKLLY